MLIIGFNGVVTSMVTVVADGSLSSDGSLLLIASLVIGGVSGELWEIDFSWEGFQWLEADDANANTVAFLRKDRKGDFLVVVCNFSPVHHQGYRVGVPAAGK